MRNSLNRENLEENGSNQSKKMSLDHYSKVHGEKNLFDRDLDEAKYNYMETIEEKEKRLKKLWIMTKRNRTIQRSLESPTNEEIININNDIVKLVRNIRYKIDQNLLKNQKHPIFGANYRKISQEEFMMDAEVEFHKIKKYLNNSPEVLQEDPEIKEKYKDLIKNLKRRRFTELAHELHGSEHKYDYLTDKTESKEDLKVVRIIII